jgi:hypothetical protein
MSYYITAFDGLTLPTAKPLHDISSDESMDMGIQVAGGGYYDANGTDRANAKLHPIRVKALLTAATAGALSTAYDAIKAKRGKYGTITMTPGGGTVTRTRMGRMLDVNADNEPGQITYTPIDITFMPTKRGWDGTFHNDSFNLTTSPGTVTFANNGNRRTTDAVITIYAGANITSAIFSLSNNPYSCVFQWSGGTVATGQSLVIDCGALTALNNGVDAWSQLSRLAQHQVDELLRLEPGNNSIVVTLTGGGTVSSVNFAHSDGWE